MTHDYTCFVLSEASSLLYESLQVERISVLENQVQAGFRLNRLVVPDAVLTVKLATDFDFSLDLLEVRLRKVL